MKIFPPLRERLRSSRLEAVPRFLQRGRTYERGARSITVHDRFPFPFWGLDPLNWAKRGSGVRSVRWLGYGMIFRYPMSGIADRGEDKLSLFVFKPAGIPGLLLETSKGAEATATQFILELAELTFKRLDEALGGLCVDSLERATVVKCLDGPAVVGNRPADFENAERPNGWIL